MDLQRDGAALSIARISKIVAYVKPGINWTRPSMAHHTSPVAVPQLRRRLYVRSYALRCISALRANTLVPLLFDLANATVCADRPKGLGVSGKGVTHMLFLFGLRTRAKSLGQVERLCSKCARPTVHNAVESRRWFTLFFIPVIPLGGNQVVRCGVCGLTTKASPELKDQLATRAMAAKA
jgi:hypothetical protein